MTEFDRKKIDSEILPKLRDIKTEECEDSTSAPSTEKYEISNLTSCSDRSKKARQQLLRVQQYSKQRSYLTKAFRGELNLSEANYQEVKVTKEGEYSETDASDNLGGFTYSDNSFEFERRSFPLGLTILCITAIAGLSLAVFAALAYLIPPTQKSSFLSAANFNLANFELWSFLRSDPPSIQPQKELTAAALSFPPLSPEPNCLSSAKGKLLKWKSNWQSDQQDEGVRFLIAHIQSYPTLPTPEWHLELSAIANAKTPYRSLTVIDGQFVDEVCKRIINSSVERPPSATLPGR